MKQKHLARLAAFLISVMGGAAFADDHGGGPIIEPPENCLAYPWWCQGQCYELNACRSGNTPIGGSDCGIQETNLRICAIGPPPPSSNVPSVIIVTGPGDDTPTPQENADTMASCIVGNLGNEDAAEVTPHSVDIEVRPRVDGRDVDGYAGCVRGHRYVTVVKESVAERGGTSLRGVLTHEIAHHMATRLENCRSYDGREHGSAFENALGKARSAAEGCN